MREESVARRYAAALLNQAKATDTITQVRDDLRKVAHALETTPALRALLGQPLVTEGRKKEMLARTVGGAVSPMTLALLNLMVDKRRVNLIDTVQAEFDRMVLDYQNIAHATATTAVPLTPEQTLALERSLEQRTGKDIELETNVDPAVIGGVLVRIGDMVLDGTVRGNLERLREQLLVRR